MNFYPFDSDHPCGYSYSSPRQRPTFGGYLLLVSLLYLVRQLFVLAGNLLWGSVYLLFLLLRLLWRTVRRISR